MAADRCPARGTLRHLSDDPGRAGVAALAYALLLPVGRSSDYATGIFPAMVLVGLALSLAYGPVNIAATNGIAAEEQGVASGLVNTSFQLGPAVVSAVNDVYHGAGTAPSALLAGLHAALVVPLVVSLIGIAAMALGGIGRRLRHRQSAHPAVQVSQSSHTS